MFISDVGIYLSLGAYVENVYRWALPNGLSVNTYKHCIVSACQLMKCVGGLQLFHEMKTMSAACWRL